MKVVVSGVSQREDKKVAYVLFEDGDFSAEGIIPDCKIIANKGFSDEKISDLEEFMRNHIMELKNKAVEINPFRALMKDENNRLGV